MINLQMLDVAIGLVFIYLLLSLVCSALKEWVAHILKWRSKYLEDGIMDLLRHGDESGIGKEFVDHPMIKKLYDENNRTAYVPSRTFMLVLLDLVAPADGNPDDAVSLRSSIEKLPEGSELRRNLTILLDDAQNCITTFKKNIETWFDDSMGKVSAIYQRNSRKVIMVIALLVSMASNADTLQIADDLVNNPVLRASVVEQAEKYLLVEHIGDDKDKLEIQLDQAQANIRSLGIPLGWDALPEFEGWSAWRTWVNWFNKVLGILITTFAISLGAPFWFDLLNKFVSIKSAGRRKEKGA